VTHDGDSGFEVVTPAVIAGVSGTRFGVTASWHPSQENPAVYESKTTVSVSEGKVLVEERATGSSTDLVKNTSLTITGYTEQATSTKSVPKKVQKKKFWLWWF